MRYCLSLYPAMSVSAQKKRGRAAYPMTYTSPRLRVAAMSGLKTVRLPRTPGLLMKERNWKSPPLQNTPEYRC